MREIKFKYGYSDSINTFEKAFTLEEIEQGLQFEEISDSPLLKNYKIVYKRQYTGLKDKNGVEIYEGDIFTMLYITPMGDITDILSNEIYLVEFKNGMFGYSSKTKFNPLEEFIIKTKGEYISNCGCKTIYNETIIEVIGNIYENQDLLKD